MPISVIMPALEMAQDTGTLVAWKKKDGESVSKGEPLLEIETDKAVVEIESPGDGVLSAIKFHEGAVVPVGKHIAWILQKGEAIPADPDTPSAKPITSQPQAKKVFTPEPSPRESGARALISPKARRLAQEQNVDLSKVTGTGPGGEILAADILAFAKHGAAAAVAASSGTSESLNAIGRIMAERTTQSWTTVPHFFLSRDLDASGLNDLRAKLGGGIEQQHKIKLSHTDILVALIARVLKRHPKMNASWAGSAIRTNPEINIGIAIAVEGGVAAAVIRHADSLLLGDIAAQRAQLTDRARSGKLQPADLAGATFTISNLGMYDIDSFTAIIVPPQAGILAVGRIRDTVVALDGKPAVRPTISLTLSCDHRVIDGAGGAQFLIDVAAAIANPSDALK